jgi:hypothetical protein
VDLGFVEWDDSSIPLLNFHDSLPSSVVIQVSPGLVGCRLPHLPSLDDREPNQNRRQSWFR